MKLIEINWQPTDRQLRQFGIICLVALPAIGWFWGAGPQLITGLAIAGGVLALAGLVAPRLLKPVFLGLSILVMPIGLVIGELAMVLIYFGVFLPIGLVFRVVRRDALHLKCDRNQPSYWKPKQQPASVASYYRQS